ncbi:MAG TPA: ABC transporter permease subunit [Candidatus Hydrogenedentes bacterium]|nr:ABC transporter permease subunit [Candidatus Hydrogenedentota bacterium]
MPIYEQTYRHYEGKMRHGFRWLIVIEQELRVLVKAKPFLLLLLVAMIHCIVRLLQVVAFDVVIQDPNNPLTPLLNQIKGLMVSEQMFFDFLRLQTPVLFLITLYAGCGMICNDFNNNLMEIYFSKPIRWYDYVVGKVSSLVIVGLMLTAVPAIFLVVLHNLLVPSMKVFQETWTWPGEIIGFSLVIVLPMALSIPAASALLRSQNYAAIVIVMIPVAASAMATVLQGVLDNRNYLILSLPIAINRIGEQLFHGHVSFHLNWRWSMAHIVGVCVLCLWIIIHKVRKAELAT